MAIYISMFLATAISSALNKQLLKEDVFACAAGGTLSSHPTVPHSTENARNVFSSSAGVCPLMKQQAPSCALGNETSPG